MKKLLSIVLALVLLTALAACGAQAPASVPDDNAGSGTNSGTAAPAERDPNAPVSTVYFTADISPEGMMAAYNALGVTLAEGIVFGPCNVEPDGPVCRLPWYMIMFFTQERMPEHFTVTPDLSALREFGAEIS